MKLDQQTDKESIAEIRNVDARKTKKLVARFTHVPGLTIWEINYVLGTCEPVVLEKYVAFNKGGVVNKQILRKENCFYLQALNKKNALKKFKKMIKDL